MMRHAQRGRRQVGRLVMMSIGLEVREAANAMSHFTHPLGLVVPGDSLHG